MIESRTGGRRRVRRVSAALLTASLSVGILQAEGLTAQSVPEFTDADRARRVAETVGTVERMFREYAEREHLPGFAYGVVLDGELVYAGAFGTADLGAGTPASARTLFRIASMSKSFTAMAVLQLRDAGRLSLDDPVSRYVPEVESLELLTGDAPEITIRHLLTHSAGFPEDNPWGDRQLAESDEMLRDMIAEGIAFSNAPGVAYEYSNLGFALLGQVVQSITGMSLPEYTQREIFAPLGMDATVWEFERAPAEDVALGYEWQDDSWVNVPLEHHGSFGAMGGLITSIEDFSKYVALHLSATPPRSDPDSGALRRSSLREMQQPWRFAGLMPDFSWPDGRSCPSVRAYGYGLRWQEDCGGRVMIGHSGGLPGFGSNWVMLPDFGFAVMSFDNRTYGGTSAINLAVVDTVFALAELQPRRLAPTPILVQRRDELVDFLPDWEGVQASNAFAENFFMDNRTMDLAARTEPLFAEAGEIRSIGAVEPLNQLRGTFLMHGDRRDIEVFFTLSPETVPRIQLVSVRLVPK